jgi:hypothetical protein
MAPHNSKKLLKRALRIDQDKERSLYLFSLKGHELLAIADISRVSRDDTGKLIGYQRPEVKKHVMDIANYSTFALGMKARLDEPQSFLHSAFDNFAD